MPIFTKNAEKLVLWLATRKAMDRERAVAIPSAAIAAPLVNARVLEKATRKRGGGSQTTVYWLAPAGVLMVKALKGPRCRKCGCTEMNACKGGCAWVRPGLCSNPKCVARANEKRKGK